MKSWRLWSTKWKATAGVIALVVIGAVAAYFAKESSEAVFPAVAASVAVGALFVTAYSSYSGSTRAKKKDTLEAWNQWSDGSRAARRRVTRLVGVDEFTEAQGKALATGASQQLSGKDGVILNEEQFNELKDDVHDILNGLERLAVGVELGIYDEAVLMLMGGTIIARLYERFEAYIEALRKSESTKTRQSKALTELTILYHMMEEPRLKKTLEGNRREVDKARLKALRGN